MESHEARFYKARRFRESIIHKEEDRNEEKSIHRTNGRHGDAGRGGTDIRY